MSTKCNPRTRHHKHVCCAIIPHLFNVALDTCCGFHPCQQAQLLYPCCCCCCCRRSYSSCPSCVKTASVMSQWWSSNCTDNSINTSTLVVITHQLQLAGTKWKVSRDKSSTMTPGRGTNHRHERQDHRQKPCRGPVRTLCLHRHLTHSLTTNNTVVVYTPLKCLYVKKVYESYGRLLAGTILIFRSFYTKRGRIF